MTSDDKTALAGELALGLLEGEERRTAERRLAHDAELRQEFAFWREKMTSLVLGRPTEPSAEVYPRIRQSLFHDDEKSLFEELMLPENRPQLAAIVITKVVLLVVIVLLLI